MFFLIFTSQSTLLTKMIWPQCFLMRFLLQNPWVLKEKILMLYSIYTLILVLPAIVWSYLLAVASLLNRIYENSLDLVDLGKPKFP